MTLPMNARDFIWMLMLLVAGSAGCASQQKPQSEEQTPLTDSTEAGQEDAEEPAPPEVEVDPDSPPL